MRDARQIDESALSREAIGTLRFRRTRCGNPRESRIPSISLTREKGNA